ncbi:MAG: PIG-L family deacetylase [Planctomycetes bacterium]|nr:PIG-L family deacetylase [Planctomycetota bacterium]
MSSKSNSGRPNIAVVVAHPDDLAHAMGGTAWLLKDKYKLHVFCASRGQRGYAAPKDELVHIRPPNAELGKIRSAEEAAACKLLGAQLAFLDQIDGEIYADPRTCRKLACALADLRPAAMFTLWPVNVPDHVAASAIATRALYLAGLADKTEIYFFENEPGGQTNQFVPDLYVNISEVIDRKRDLIRCHKSQNPDENAVAKVIRRNVMRGLCARCDYAEPFKTPDPLINARKAGKMRYLLLDL